MTRRTETTAGRRVALLAVVLLTATGCTLNIYVLPGVKTDLRWPASQPAAGERQSHESDCEDEPMPDTFAKFRHIERPATLYRVNLDVPDAPPQFLCDRKWVNSELERDEFRMAAAAGRFVEEPAATAEAK